MGNARYTPETLRNMFHDLRNIAPFTIIPLVDVSFQDWIVTLPNQLIWNVRRLPQKPRTQHNEYSLNMNGKIVSAIAEQADINTKDPHNHLYATRAVSFQGPEDLVSKAYEDLVHHVEIQPLPSLMPRAKQELSSQGEVRLDNAMLRFYFGHVE